MEEKPRLREGDASSEHPAHRGPCSRLEPARPSPVPGAGAQRLHITDGLGLSQVPQPPDGEWRSHQMPRFRSLTLGAHLPPGEQSLSDNRDSTGQCALRKHPTSQIQTRLSGHSCCGQAPRPCSAPPSSHPPLVVHRPLPTPSLPTHPHGSAWCQGASKGPLAPSLSSNQQPEGSLATNSDTLLTDSRMLPAHPAGRLSPHTDPEAHVLCDLTAFSPRSSTPAAASCFPCTHWHLPLLLPSVPSPRTPRRLLTPLNPY